MTFLNHIYKFKSKLAISDGKVKYTYSSIEKKSMMQISSKKYQNVKFGVH